MTAKDRRLAELRERITSIEPEEALMQLAQGAVLIDVREPDEIAQGSPEGAARLGRGYLELRVEDAVPNLDAPVLVMCAGGTRSLFAADGLLNMGYTQVYSVAGGFSRWKNRGLPFEVPKTLDDDARERYARHLVMPDVGEAGQMKLMDAKVLLIGAGGLGSPCAYYLGAAGVGKIGLVDHDVVDRSNLQRQIIHTEDSIGMPKVESAKQRLLDLNPRLQIETYQTHIDSANVDDIMAGYDIVVDGTDNLPTRYLVNDACIKHGIPNVHAAVYRFEGQITVFWPSHEDGSPCYRCMFPEPPSQDAAPSCAQAGVLGVMPGVLGLLQAVETVKIILGLGTPLRGQMLYYDALRSEFRRMKLPKRKDCPSCGADADLSSYVDYAQVCASA